MMTSVIPLTRLARAAGVAALLAGTAFVAPAIAQDNQTQSEQADTGTTSSPAGTGESGEAGQNVLLATVNGVEIRQSDITQVISSLPPQMRQLPPEMVVSMAVDQVVTQELFLEQARSQDLGNDPEVRSLVEPLIEQLTEQAMVQVWLSRQFEEEVDEARLQEAFSQFEEANPDSEVTFEQARPQLEQAVRRAVLAELTASLSEGADIVFYDASGAPVDPAASAEGGQTGGGQDGNAGAADADANADADAEGSSQ
ncbi:MAG TPA: hypothetical protein VGN80_14465 [Devosiaceae bacterium]|jgi:hypothetical protein|nr:hypothetical protein [Devosiaceae bacterium]